MPTHYRGTQEEVQALNLYIKLMRAAASVEARVNHHLAEAGLTISQFGILESLYHLGPLCQKDIAGKILKSTANITYVIDNLEKRDLVERRRSESDRRYIDVFLTDEGRALLEDIFPPHVQRVQDEFAILSEAEQAELSRLLRKVGTQSEK